MPLHLYGQTLLGYHITNGVLALCGLSNNPLSLYIPLIRLILSKSVCDGIGLGTQQQKQEHNTQDWAPQPPTKKQCPTKPREGYKGREKRTALGAAVETTLNTQPLALRSTRVVHHAVIT